MKQKSGFKTDRTDRTDTEMDENTGNEKSYFSTASLNREIDEEFDDEGVLINDLSAQYGRGNFNE